MAENGTIKERADREKEENGVTAGRNGERGRRGVKEWSELEETPAGVVVLVWTELSGRGDGSGARVRAQRLDWCDTQKDRA